MERILFSLLCIPPVIISFPFSFPILFLSLLLICFIPSSFYFISCAAGRGGDHPAPALLPSWTRIERILADNSSTDQQLNSTLALAAHRTYRKDPLDDFNKYKGGWNVSNRHYWAVKFSPFYYFYLDCVILSTNWLLVGEFYSLLIIAVVVVYW